MACIFSILYKILSFFVWKMFSFIFILICLSEFFLNISPDFSFQFNFFNFKWSDDYRKYFLQYFVFLEKIFCFYLFIFIFWISFFQYLIFITFVLIPISFNFELPVKIWNDFAFLNTLLQIFFFIISLSILIFFTFNNYNFFYALFIL